MTRLALLVMLMGGLVSTAIAADATTVSVADFGAKPDDGQDDSAAFLAAAEACNGKSNVTLLIPKGQYHLSEANLGPTRRAMNLTKVEGLTIDGEGSTLMFKGRAIGFWLTDCQNVTIRNLTIDSERPQFSQGKVLSATSRQIVVEVDADYPLTGQEKLAGMMDFDPATRRPIGNLDAFEGSFAGKTLLRPQVMQVDFKRDLRYPPPAGTLVVLRHEVYGHNAFQFVGCRDVNVEDVTVHTAPGMALHAGDTQNISLTRFRIVRPPGSNRLMTTTADGTFFSMCSGEINIRDCEYEACSDDAINVSSKYLVVRDVVGSDELTAAPEVGWRGIVPRPGDKLEIAARKDLVPAATVTVKSASYDASAKVHRIRLAEPVEKLPVVGDVLMNVSIMPRTTISNTTIRGNRARAIILSTRNATISHCDISGQTMNGIFLVCDPRRFGSQGPGSSNITITHNRLSGCGGSPIIAYTGVTDPRPGVFENLTIDNNRFIADPAMDTLRHKQDKQSILCWSSAVYLGTTHGASLSGNAFEGFDIAAYLGASDQIRWQHNSSTNPAKVLLGDGSPKPEFEDNTKLELNTQDAAEMNAAYQAFDQR